MEQKTSTGTVSFKAASISEKERNETYVSGILNGGSTVADMSGEYLPALGFWNGKEYARATQQNTAAITKDSIRQVSIDMPADAAGAVKTRYFRQIDYMDGTDNKNGLNVTAWQEIDRKGQPVLVDKEGNPAGKDNGKQVIRMSFTGFLEPLQDTPALHEGVQGRLNPQTLDAVTFASRVAKQLDNTAGKDKYEVIYHSHSFGSSPLRAARATMELQGVPSRDRALLFDAGAIGDSQSDLIKMAMNVPSSSLYKHMQSVLGPDIASKENLGSASQKLNHNTLLVVPIEQGKNGEWHGSSVANAVPGSGWGGGLSDLIESGIVRNDRALNSSSKYGDVILVKVGKVPNYATSSALGFVDSAHQEVPLVYAATNPDNFVAPVHKPNGKPPVTIASLKEDAAVLSATPLAATIKALGGNGQLVIDSAVENSKGNFGTHVKLMGKALLSVFSQTDQQASVQPPTTTKVSSNTLNLK